MQGNSIGSLVAPSSTCKVPASARISPSTVAPSNVTDRVAPVTARCASCCSNDNGNVLHRMKQDGVVRHHCSSCILSKHRNMYCSQCFQTYSDPNLQGDTNMWVTCYNCQRLAHLTCTRDHGANPDSLQFKCQYCKEASTVGDGIPPHKKARLTEDLQDRTGFHVSNDDLCVLEAFAAAQIVVTLAAKKANDARAKARACAAHAVKAADRVKNALDTAHRAAQEEFKWKAEVNRQLLRDTRKTTTATEFAKVTANDDTTPQLKEKGADPTSVELRSSIAAAQDWASSLTQKAALGHVNVDGSAPSRILKGVSVSGDGFQTNAQKSTIPLLRNGTNADTCPASNGVPASDVSLESKADVKSMSSLDPNRPNTTELAMVGARNDKAGKVSDNSMVSSKISSVAAISNTEPRNSTDDCSASLQSSKEHTPS